MPSKRASRSWNLACRRLASARRETVESEDALTMKKNSPEPEPWPLCLIQPARLRAMRLHWFRVKLATLNRHINDLRTRLNRPGLSRKQRRAIGRHLKRFQKEMRGWLAIADYFGLSVELSKNLASVTLSSTLCA